MKKSDKITIEEQILLSVYSWDNPIIRDVYNLPGEKDWKKWRKQAIDKYNFDSNFNYKIKLLIDLFKKDKKAAKEDLESLCEAQELSCATQKARIRELEAQVEEQKLYCPIYKDDARNELEVKDKRIAVFERALETAIKNYDAVDPIDRKFVEKLKKDFIEQAEQEIK